MGLRKTFIDAYRKILSYLEVEPEPEDAFKFYRKAKEAAEIPKEEAKKLGRKEFYWHEKRVVVIRSKEAAVAEAAHAALFRFEDERKVGIGDVLHEVFDFYAQVELAGVSYLSLMPGFLWYGKVKAWYVREMKKRGIPEGEGKKIVEELAIRHYSGFHGVLEVFLAEVSLYFAKKDAEHKVAEAFASYLIEQGVSLEKLAKALKELARRKDYIEIGDVYRALFNG